MDYARIRDVLRDQGETEDVCHFVLRCKALEWDRQAMREMGGSGRSCWVGTKNPPSTWIPVPLYMHFFYCTIVFMNWCTANGPKRAHRERKSFLPHVRKYSCYSYPGDILVFSVSALALDNLYRRGGHTQSAMDFSSQRDISDTHASSRGSGRILAF